VHCRLYQRHKEYREVFDRLFDEIRSTGVTDSMIVVTGDIVHGKTDMTPELVSLVSYFFKGCAELCPTLIIPGNHDLSISNIGRLDALSPIVEAMDHPNIIYWKGSGSRLVGDVMFHHYSIYGDWDKIEIPNDANDVTHIALYHGAVSGASTDIGFSEFTSAIPVNTFEPYDITLLGDIHKTQYLNDAETIAYPGSLIQQDHGESMDRGILIWDVERRTSEFKCIPNDYGFVTLNFTDGSVVESVDIPEKPRVRIIYDGKHRDKLKSFSDTLKARFDVKELRVNESKVDKKDKTIKIDDIINSRKSEVQMKLYREFLSDYELDEDMWSQIESINTELNERVRVVDSSSQGIKWNPVEFEFSNMFSYGEGNKIDFTELSGLVGLFAPNASGKSTFLDAIVFCIFDKCSRTSKAAMVMNNESDEFYCRFHFQIGESDFEIIRKGVRNKNGSVSVFVDFYKDGECLTGKRRDETNKIIRDYIGTYDDFVLTTLSTQNDNRSFIEMTKKERQELLYRFLDIYVFVELFKMAKDDSKELSIEMKLLGGENYEEVISTHSRKIADHKNELRGIELEINNVEKSINEITGITEELASQLIKIDDMLDLDSLNKVISTHESDLARYLAKKKSLISDKEDNIKLLENKTVPNIDIGVERDTNQKLHKAMGMLREDKQSIRVLETEKSHLQSKISSLENHEYDPDCIYCTKNPFVMDAKQAVVEMERVNLQLSELKNKVIAESEIVKRLEISDKNIEKYENYQKSKLGIEQRILNCDSEINNLENLITLTNERIEVSKGRVARYYEQEDQISKNNKINTQLQEHRTSRTELQNKVSSKRAEYDRIKSELVSIEHSYNTALERKSRYNEVVSKFKAYEYYMEAVNRNGVPYMILKKILPIIESEVNEVLDGIVDFKFRISIDDNDAIDANIEYGDKSWAVELTSGMERFILSISIRSSLIGLSGLPKPNFLAIDEGFGVLDKTKLNSIYVLFDYLKDNFDFIMCISHILSMRDHVDRIITIDKVDGRSKISLS
jgi:DNA repair exonuclease SbcCD ATPase subunit/DNA repair exonuclease SbcCD nuclease subunit